MGTQIDDNSFGEAAVHAENSERGGPSGDEFRRKHNRDSPSLGRSVLRNGAGSSGQEQGNQSESGQQEKKASDETCRVWSKNGARFAHHSAAACMARS